MIAHSGGLHRWDSGRRFAQHAPRNVGTEVFTPDNPVSFPLDLRTTFGGDWSATAQPLADGGLPDPKRDRHRGLTPEVFDRPLDCIHGVEYRHCRCTKQAHCLLEALPVEITPMYTGPQLGNALKAAMKMKGATQAEVAAAFGIRQPSVSEWLKFGRVGKKHITKLVEWFSDVVGPEHWGLPATWAMQPDTNVEPHLTLSPEEIDLIKAYREQKLKRTQTSDAALSAQRPPRTLAQRIADMSPEPQEDLPPGVTQIPYNPDKPARQVTDVLAALSGLPSAKAVTKHKKEN